MQQFCQTLAQRNWKAAIGNMVGLKEASMNQLVNALADDPVMQRTMDQALAKSRCEVLGAQGNQVRVRVSGADARFVMEGAMNDEAFLKVYLANMQGSASDEALQSAMMQAMQRQYASGKVPALTQTVNVEMERNGNRWVLSDKGVEVLLDGMMGGIRQLIE